jgi:hypothetical protein
MQHDQLLEVQFSLRLYGKKSLKWFLICLALLVSGDANPKSSLDDRPAANPVQTRLDPGKTSVSPTVNPSPPSSPSSRSMPPQNGGKRLNCRCRYGARSFPASRSTSR